jgi:hypothetical protein
MPYCPRHNKEWSNVHGKCPLCFHTVDRVRSANHPAILFIGAGLLSTAISAIGTPVLALTCPEGEEVVKVGGIEYCQPTTPITFPSEGDAGDFTAAHLDDPGSGRDPRLEKDDRGEFPRRCTGGSNPTCTD